MENSLFTIDGISLVRQGKKILDHVSFDAAPGDFITIIGPNGAGKTMLLKALIGLVTPDEGVITKRPGLKIGYVPQRFTAQPSLPINVYDFLRLEHQGEDAAIDEKLAAMNLTSLAPKFLYQLSGGEMQRVLLLRALLQKPDLLILDEPAQNLDIGGQVAFYQLIEKIYREEECAILMVSHDLHLVMASSTKVICFYHHICCAGSATEVTQDPRFQNIFGADFAKLMAVYEHHHSAEHHCHEEPHS